MLKYRVLLTVMLAAILSLPLVLNASISEVGMLSLTIEPGARQRHGKSFLGSWDDTTRWWNPGTTAFNRKTQIAATHMPWLQPDIDDMFYDTLASINFDGIGNLNAHLLLLNAGSQEQTDEHGDWLDNFTVFDFAAAVGYSYEVIPGSGRWQTSGLLQLSGSQDRWHR